MSDPYQPPYLPFDPHAFGSGEAYEVDEETYNLRSSTASPLLLSPATFDRPEDTPRISGLRNALYHTTSVGGTSQAQPQAQLAPTRITRAFTKRHYALPRGIDAWEFPGWGTVSRIRDIHRAHREAQPTQTTPLLGAKQGHSTLLGQLPATAIAGNDITSSCLYTAGICAYYAGVWAPVSLVIVAVVLYLFREIYGEVVSALPINGGTYTALLNTTTKSVAAVAAVLTLLSYVSTAVVSAATASAYFHSLMDSISVEAMTVGILLFFALLTLLGMSESAPVATAFFLMHIATLVVLVCDCVVVAFKDEFQLLRRNWYTDPATIEGAPNFSTPVAIFFGFCAALLGISGFETSANYVEEQKPGVFIKTLKNMWALVSFFNPIIGLMAISVLPLDEAMGLPLKGGRPDNDDLLIDMASTTWLKRVVAVDATLVLSGAVLTSYVGVTGLIRRMALDRCLPSFFLTTNRWRGTNHYVIVGFFATCTSLYFIMGCNTMVLSGVYTMSFLSVMLLFGFANIVLKYKRSKIPRAVRAQVPAVLFAMVAIGCGLAGNIYNNIPYLPWFGVYFAVFGGIVFIQFQTTSVLRIILKWLIRVDHNQKMVGRYKPTKWVMKRAMELSLRIRSQRMVFFVKDEPLYVLNKAILYVRNNEQTSWLQFVHCYDTEDEVVDQIERDLKSLDRAYPKMRFDFLAVRGKFDREMVGMLSDYLHVPRHFMFIACPGETFRQDIASLGGVRIITY